MGHPLTSTLRAAAGWALACALAGTAAAQTSGTCAPAAPLLSGPGVVQAGESYAVSWTNVLGDRAVPSNVTDGYMLQRATDPSFTTPLDSTSTQRSALTLTPPPSGVATVYHRVFVRSSSCPTVAAIVSNVLAVSVKSVCDVPPSVGELTASPPNPPAFSTWVVTWDTAGTGAGPGGGYKNLKFRIRRTSSLEPDGREWVVETGAASFTGPPGDYVFEVRAEAACGAVGPWSPPKRVTVGIVPKPTLVLVSEPRPLAQLVPAAGAASATSFTVRNGGTETVTALTKCEDAGFVISPPQLTLAPGAAREVSVSPLYSTALARPVRTSVSVTSGGETLSVPIALMLAPAAAAAPVSWSTPDADVDVDGTGVLRSLVNPGATAAAFVATIKVPWITVESLDGQPWDRPLAPFETRPVRLVIDRAKRRGETGTEVGAVALTTVGWSAPQTLVVTDDGPRILPAATGSASAPAASAKTRVLYASFPNAIDARHVGRYAADLWLTNTDAVNPITLSLFFSPVGAPNNPSALRRFDIRLGPGEMRRYRNIVATLLGSEGAYTVEVRSTAPTVGATALVTNKALPEVAALRRAVAGTPATGSYGFEMRPTVPGEGAKQSDPVHVVSGLAHDANRRSNLLLLETTGYDTTVDVALFDGAGNPVLKNGQPVLLEKTIPANGTLQINDADELFDANPLPGSYAYANVTWQSSAADATGAQKGAVVGMATVIDNRTQDSSLHVGVSINALNPAYVPVSTLASRTSLAALPYGGDAAPLLFPGVHSSGATLATGEKPFWRTRVTFTNTGDQATDRRQVTLEYQPAGSTSSLKWSFGLSPRAIFAFEDLFEEAGFALPGENAFGSIKISAARGNDDNWTASWAGVDVQTETYTVDPAQGVGDFKTGMEGYTYFHGYSSFQSNLGTMSFDGAENSTNYRTNLILHEVGGSWCDVVIAAYLPGSFVPVAAVTKRLGPQQYFSDELFANILGLNLTEVTDVRIVVRQTAGDGVFLAFASKIDRASGDPANIFLRPAAAGTGR
jgi:hypothetical protein